MRRLEGLCAGKESEWKGVIVRERWGVGAAYWRHVGLVRVETERCWENLGPGPL